MQTYRISYEMRYRGRLVRNEGLLLKQCRDEAHAIERATKYLHKWYTSVNAAFQFAKIVAVPYVELIPTPALGYFEDEV